jgi:hypothetical protein
VLWRLKEHADVPVEGIWDLVTTRNLDEIFGEETEKRSARPSEQMGTKEPRAPPRTGTHITTASRIFIQRNGDRVYDSKRLTLSILKGQGLALHGDRIILANLRFVSLRYYSVRRRPCFEKHN